MADHESTMKYKVDISELKKNLTDANRSIREAQSEFKAASSSMEDWRKSSEGLEAKIKSLNKVYDLENKKLEAIGEQLKKTEEKFGKNSTAAENLRIRLNNQQAQVNKTRLEIAKYEKALSDFKKQVDEAEQSVEDMTDELEKAETTARKTEGYTMAKDVMSDLVADGIENVTSKVKDMVIELAGAETAYSNFATKTGQISEEYNGVIDSLYKKGHGGDRLEISNALAEVQQQTGELDPTKLETMTENALTLARSFGYDVKESIRAVNMLTKQFGVESDTAFSLIIQGTQSGLDKNGDMLDVINEYSSHYSQQGYSATEFFNSLINGSKAGTFSVDKLGGAMKEFSIRSKDTADSTTESFSLIGLDADEMRTKFAEGGEASKEATQQVTEALFSLDDKVIQNQAGVALFGTMWEDLGKDGVQALLDVNGEMTTATEKLDEVKEMQFDDVESEITSLFREIETEFVAPLVEEWMPEIHNGIDWVSDNLPDIIPTLTTIAGIIAGMWTITKVGNFISALSMLASPAGIATLSITGVATAIGGLAYAIKNSDVKPPKDVQEHIDKVNELKDSYEKAKENRDKLVTENSSEFQYYNNLWLELQKITDENGKIKAGYEDRAKFIAKELRQVTEEEITIVGGSIQAYDNLKTNMEDVLKLKQAQGLLASYETDYYDAISQKGTAETSYNDILLDVDAYEKAIAREREKITQYQIQLDNISFNPYQQQKLQGQILASQSNINNYNAVLNEGDNALYKKLQEAESVLVGYDAVIKNYEKTSEAILSEDTTKIEDALNKIQHSFVTAEIGTKATLEKQVSDIESKYNTMKKTAQIEGAKVNKEELKNLENLLTSAKDELELYNSQQKYELSDSEKKLVDHITKTHGMFNDFEKTTNKTNQKITSSAPKTANKYVDDFGNALNSDSNKQKIDLYSQELADTMSEDLLNQWNKNWSNNDFGAHLFEEVVKSRSNIGLPDLSNQSTRVTNNSSSTTYNYNITQNNTSTQPIDPLEHYRNTRRLIGNLGYVGK